MTAIKLPVRAYVQNADYGLLWAVRDSENVRLAHSITESQAKEIARALNLHDELVKALTSIRDMTNADDEKSYRSDDRDGCLDTCFAVAQKAVALAATSNESKT